VTGAVAAPGKPRLVPPQWADERVQLLIDGGVAIDGLTAGEAQGIGAGTYLGDVPEQAGDPFQIAPEIRVAARLLGNGRRQVVVAEHGRDVGRFEEVPDLDGLPPREEALHLPVGDGAYVGDRGAEVPTVAVEQPGRHAPLDL